MAVAAMVAAERPALVVPQLQLLLQVAPLFLTKAPETQIHPEPSTWRQQQHARCQAVPPQPSCRAPATFAAAPAAVFEALGNMLTCCLQEGSCLRRWPAAHAPGTAALELKCGSGPSPTQAHKALAQGARWAADVPAAQVGFTPQAAPGVASHACTTLASLAGEWDAATEQAQHSALAALAGARALGRPRLDGASSPLVCQLRSCSTTRQLLQGGRGSAGTADAFEPTQHARDASSSRLRNGPCSVAQRTGVHAADAPAEHRPASISALPHAALLMQACWWAAT